MSFNIRHRASIIALLLGVSFSACASDAFVASEVGSHADAVGSHADAVRVLPLELACGSAPPDVVGDVVSILGSIEPLDPSLPQAYGSAECAGFMFEFDNPDAESLRGAWVQASGESAASLDLLSESRCPDRRLETEYWGYKDREWCLLDATSTTATFEPAELPGTGYCHLESLIEHEATFEKLRIVARVTDGTDTYPMYACVW